jgi:hypothetical protein
MTCAICRATKYPKRARQCFQCKSWEPPHAEVLDKGESWKFKNVPYGKELRQAAKEAKLSLKETMYDPSFSYGTLLDGVLQPRKISRRTSWFTQVFHDGGRYLGELAGDICHMGMPDAVVNYMAYRKMMQFRVAVDLHAWFKRYCVRKNTTMSDVLIEYLEYLRQKDEKSASVDQI